MPNDGPPSTGAAGDRAGPGVRLAGLGLLALGMMIPVTLPVPVLRELVQERFDVSEFLTSLFMSVNMLGALIAAPLVGALADRWGRRRPLLVASLAVDAGCFLALTAPFPYPVFLAIRSLEGCAHIAALSMLLTLASQLLPAERRGRAMGVVGGAMMLGVALGAPLGGLLGRSDAHLPLRVGAGLLLLATLLAATVSREGTRGDRRPGFAAILRALRRHPAMLAPLAFAFADRFTVGFFTTTFSLYLKRVHEFSSPQVGAAIAVFMLPFALLSYPFGQLAERRSPVALMCCGSLVYGVGTAAVGLAGAPEIYWLMFGLGVSAAVMFVPSMLLTLQLAPDAARATALGAFNAAGSLGFLLGPAAGGAITQLVAGLFDWPTGYLAAFAVAGASELVCIIVALPVFARLGRPKASG